MLIKIAWRNLWRSKKRSLVIVFSIIIGLWSGIFLVAFYNGMIEQRIRIAISQEVSHLQFHHSSFKEDFDPKLIIPEGPIVLKRTIDQPGVKAATGRIILNGMITSASGTSGVKINGVIPHLEQAVTGLQNKMTEGTYLDSTNTNQILLSKRLIAKLKLKLGKKTILTFQDKEGEICSAAFKISGIFQTVNGPYDESNVFVRIKDVDTLCHIPDQFHEISILLYSNKNLEETQAAFQNLFMGLKIENWKEISPELDLTVSASDQVVFIYLGIILLALAFGIINTMMMSVLERTKELGMLMALGMNKLKIFTMILLETLLLVFTGSPFGVALALLTIQLSNIRGINIKAYEEVYSSFGYSDTIFPELALRQFWIVLIMVICTALFSGLIPAKRVLKLKPVESIRN